jgi:hypothetical protein
MNWEIDWTDRSALRFVDIDERIVTFGDQPVFGYEFDVILADAIEAWLDEFEPELDCDECGEVCHTHFCQQCAEILTEHCHCEHPVKMDWCSPRCRAAFDNDIPF